MKNKKELFQAPLIEISSDAVDEIKRHVAACPDHETGGILLGHSASEEKIIVEMATGPGPKALHSKRYFVRDTSYCQSVYERHFYQNGWEYIGDWHSHLECPKFPSAGDVMTLDAVLHDKDYDFDAFLMLLALPSRSGINIKVYVEKREGICEVPYVVV